MRKRVSISVLIVILMFSNVSVVFASTQYFKCNSKSSKSDKYTAKTYYEHLEKLEKKEKKLNLRKKECMY